VRVPRRRAISVVVTGWLSDRIGVNGRSLLLFLGLSTTAAALLVLMSMHSSRTGALLPLLAIGTVAFCPLGTYSYLGGAFALDFGGKQAPPRPRDHRTAWAIWAPLWPETASPWLRSIWFGRRVRVIVRVSALAALGAGSSLYFEQAGVVERASS